MSKKPMTWLELIKLKLGEEKAKGKSPSIGDVTPLAKKEWVQIKEGKHPLYIQGKAQTFARKKKTGSEKTRKLKGSSPRSASSPGASSAELEQLLAELKMCGKCKKKVDKYMKKKVMKGGNTCSGPAPAPITGGGQAAGCSSCPM